METNVSGLPNQEDFGGQMEGNPGDESVSQVQVSENSPEEIQKSKHRHHDDHHVNRKYKVFSNHSSYGDSPHTNTSF